ncbi:MAG: helix-hairpin-helix domain-containing protein [Roseburia sp.]|nr:helix-hairpin-helix domain-containing protein [Roseburia sp.]
MEKSQYKYVLVVLAIIICGAFWFFGQRSNEGQEENADFFTGETTDEGENEETEQTGQKIYIHIVGAVKKPGVYIFDEKPRVVEVVEKAGGFKKGAIKSEINQAEIVEDGAQIVVRSSADKKQDSREEQTEESGGKQGDSGLLDINHATKEELMTLSGIGEAKAMAIISYRETNGNFKKIEDIMNITGIKSGVYEKIKDQIRV